MNAGRLSFFAFGAVFGGLMGAGSMFVANAQTSYFSISARDLARDPVFEAAVLDVVGGTCTVDGSDLSC